jgi:membrane protein EpsK
MLPGALAMVMTAGVSRLIANYFQVSGLTSLLICGVILTMVYVYGTWTFSIKNKERKIIKKFLPFSKITDPRI